VFASFRLPIKAEDQAHIQGHRLCMKRIQG
jgi:hypothetical protein